ncbi:hypothetical protein CYQ88_01060 [Hydrogenovibrio sp. SC-1]|uniref:tetratricopeptide repeat protein n=1 Tax=Hydrogenovibrio sp. SC-1 TaxID=2065820 RepID=UPI000C7D308B|nr:tetratricopeptide repeat protein [Hydrogenovibrio sp. SC-1]PLA75584.1 hypothetical protein CYQ88_01060 [Hydrogenovibrio sp. SC-1]
MSALLAALKKAAEEKNKRQQHSPLSSSTSTKLDNESAVEMIQMDFAEGVDLSESVSETTPGNPENAPAMVHLDFVDDSLNVDLSPPAQSITQSPIPEEPPEDENEPELIQKSSETDLDDLSPLELASEETLSLETESNSEIETDNQLASEVTDSPSETDSSSLRMVEDSADEAMNSNQRLDLETSLALNDESTSLPKTAKDSQVSHQVSKQAEAELKENSEIDEIPEDDWSLDQIPGYQHANDIQPGQHKMQRFIRAIQPKGGLKGHLSFKYWMWVPLILFGFGYFGLIIFEQESQRMATDLKPFQMLPLKTPNSLQAAKQATAVTSKNDLTQSETKKQDSILNDVTKNQIDPSTGKGTPSESRPSQSDQAMPLASKLHENTQFPKSISPKVPVIKPKPVENTDVPSDSRYKIETVKPNRAVFDGYDAYVQGDYAVAERYYQQAYLADPESLPVLFGLAATAAKKGESQKSLAMYQKILKKVPNNQEAAVAAAMLEARLMEGPELRAKLERLIRQMPRNSQLQTALGHQYAKNRDWVLAQKYYLKAYELDPNNPTHARNLAISLDQLGQYASAKQYYEQTLALSNLKQTDQRQLKNRLLVIKQHLLEEAGQ